MAAWCDSSAMARLSFDFRHIPEEMRYDDHYRIAVFVNGHLHTTPYPPSFWMNPPVSIYPEWRDYRVSKSDTFRLHLTAMREITFRVELQILHGLYSDQLSQFIGTMGIEIFEFNRADPLATERTGERWMLSPPSRRSRSSLSRSTCRSSCRPTSTTRGRPTSSRTSTTTTAPSSSTRA